MKITKVQSVLCSFFLLSGFSFSMHAQEMKVFKKDGTHQSFKLKDISKMFCKDAQFHVMETKDVKISLTDISVIKFENLSGLETPRVVDSESFSVKVCDRIVKIEGINAGRVNIYSIGGQNLYSNPEWKGEDITLSNVTSGIYLIKVNNKTNKIIIK
jgi:hypothetical protein